MLVDVVFPGWMPWARLGQAEDVDLQSAFLADLRAAGERALQSARPGEGLEAKDTTNPYAVFDSYLDRAAIGCVNELTPKWANRLAGFDVFIWDQCYAIQSYLQLE